SPGKATNFLIYFIATGHLSVLSVKSVLERKESIRGKRRKAVRGRKGKYTGDGDFFVRLSRCAE
ncbi:MAG: hypothetical protein SPF79_03925, partial [Bacteroidaceae bacterium]|nr:hypothetical protein [Bacteroidaceae bacterium]